MTEDKTSSSETATESPGAASVAQQELVVSDSEKMQQEDAEPCKSPSKRRKKEHIKRPMNAFMVWSVAQRKLLSKEQPKIHNTELSKKLGQMWKDLSEDEKQPFREQASKLKEDHMERYPDYKYRPKRKKVPKTKTPSLQSDSDPSSFLHGDSSPPSAHSPTIVSSDDYMHTVHCTKQPHLVSTADSSRSSWYWPSAAFSRESPPPVYHSGTASFQPSHQPAHTFSTGTTSYWAPPPQPSSPMDYPCPPAYQGSPGYQSSSSYQNSPCFPPASHQAVPPTDDCQPQENYFFNSYPPNQEAPVNECNSTPLNLASSGCFNSQTSFKQEGSAICPSGDFALTDLSSSSMADAGFLDFNSLAHTTGAVELNDHPIITSPPTPPISPQVTQSVASNTTHPAIPNVYHSSYPQVVTSNHIDLYSYI